MSISKTVFDERRYRSFWGDTRLNKQGDMENMIINLHTHIQTHTHTLEEEGRDQMKFQEKIKIKQNKKLTLKGFEKTRCLFV